MSKRSLIIAGLAILLVVVAFVSMFIDIGTIKTAYEDLLNGKELNEPDKQKPDEPAAAGTEDSKEDQTT